MNNKVSDERSFKAESQGIDGTSVEPDGEPARRECISGASTLFLVPYSAQLGL